MLSFKVAENIYSFDEGDPYSFRKELSFKKREPQTGRKTLAKTQAH